MRRRYIFFDVDNTLVSHVNGSHIPPETREALRLLRENGHVPAIATGRAALLTRMTAAELDIDIMVCGNGAHIFCAGEEIYSSLLPGGALDSFRAVAKDNPELAVAVDDRAIYTDNTSPDFADYFAAQAGRPCVRPLKELREAYLCYLMVPPLNMETPPYLPAQYRLFSSPSDGVTLEPMRYFIEARASGTSKWKGIQRVAGHLGLDAQDIVTFGDGPNDMEMLSRAPVSVAVGRAVEKVKQAASFVCGDIDEGGILEACSALGLLGA